MQRSFGSIVLLFTLATGLGGTANAETLISRTAAARYGLDRAWFAQVGSPQSTGVINHVNYDRGMLLVQTARGLLSGLDAETGRVVWCEQVGATNHLSSEAAGNEKFVAVVNGSMLYVLDRDSGKLLWSKQLIGSPSAGPGVSKTHVFVPMVDGRMEAYALDSNGKEKPWVYKSFGHILTPPVATPQTICWTTDKGYLYVADPSSLGIRYRLETRGAIHSRPAFWTPNLLACSTDGCVYAVNEAKGKIAWKYAVGDAIFESPVAINDMVFVVSELSGMYCLDAKVGGVLWQAPRIVQFVSLSPNRVYAVDQVGRLAVLDAKTGARLTSMSLEGTTLKLINNECDRIYVANSAGVMQCLHEAGLATPVIYTPPEPEKVELKAKSAPKKPKTEPTEEEPSAEEMPADEAPAMDADAPEEPASDESDPFK